MEKIPYLKDLKAGSDGAAEFFLMDDPMKSGQWLFIQHATMENETTAFTRLRIGQGKDEFDVHWWEEWVGPGVDILYWAEELFFVPEGHRVITRWDGTTAGDRLAAYLDGYTTPKVLSREVFKDPKRP